MMSASSLKFEIEGKKIGDNFQTYFIADIAANHDGDIERAINLIYLAAEAGADAAKFQHFTADTIVSNFGFNSLNINNSHQSSWKKSVYEVYKEASINLEWTSLLKDTCNKAGIAFFTSPYSIELVDYIDSYVPAYKIGSGDITWIEIIQHIASKKKPYLIATGASSLIDVKRAVSAAVEINPMLCLMQCNTNYTGNLENFRHIQLSVLNLYARIFPDILLGLSDHTPGHTTVLGAISMGAKIIEKHFTDDNNRSGPDHAFSMDPIAWRDMVNRARELELAIGNGVKVVESNEIETSILQRRAIRAAINLAHGTVLEKSHLVCLRPCPPNSLAPFEISQVIGKKIKRNLVEGEALTWTDLQ